MNDKRNRLYELLPVVYRQRDAEVGYPLRDLLRVISKQVNVVENDIAQLYANWFIETCDDWVVPYIGDLIGYRPVHGRLTSDDSALSARDQQRNAVLIPRREVANTIHYRRRKGTFALLEDLAHDIAGWPARAVSYYQLLAWTQALNHLYMDRGRYADLRDREALARLGTPFDSMAHTVDVRRINSGWRTGRFNIGSVGLFVWRMRSYPVTQCQAYRLERGDDLRFTFNVMRADMQLFTKAISENTPGRIAQAMDVPAPITRQVFENNLAAYYGTDKSLQVWRGVPPEPVSMEEIVAADLSDWERYRVTENKIAVDPELGRILLHPRALPGDATKVWVSYHYGFADDLGGGEYSRRPLPTLDYHLYKVGGTEVYRRIDEAVKELHKENSPDKAVIEITDSRVYSEQINIRLRKDQVLHIRAGDRCRPVLRQLDYDPSLTDAFSVTGKTGSRFIMDGVLLTGRPLCIQGDLAMVMLRHTTLVPGWTVDPDLQPMRGEEPSLQIFDAPNCRVKIERCILGTIHVKLNEVDSDPIPIEISDSILDATSPDLEAIGVPEWRLGEQGQRKAHAVLTIQRSTVFGRVDVHAIELAENSIFNAVVTVNDRQQGCVRFCYLPLDSVIPRRFNCQPDLMKAAIDAQIAAGTLSEDEGELAVERKSSRVQPRFSNQRYGTPDYAQLTAVCASEITMGADDESEMGVYHDLYQPQRLANLRARLEEYTPAGMDVGIIFAS